MDLSGYSRLTLTNREDFADDLALFRVQAAETVSFTPGQYATIGLMDAETDRPLLRPYSVVSAPDCTELEFFIERVDEGKLTPRLWELSEGDDVWMRDKIVGRFVLDTERQHHVMAATVTGVGPYVSIARHQQRMLREGHLDTPNRFLIVHGGSRSWELGSYRDELTALAASVDWLDYVPTVSRPWDDPDWGGEVGRVGDVLRKHMDAAGVPLHDTAGYACGHPKMIENVQGMFERTGLPEDAIHEEKYFVERRAA